MTRRSAVCVYQTQKGMQQESRNKTKQNKNKENAFILKLAAAKSHVRTAKTPAQSDQSLLCALNG